MILVLRSEKSLFALKLLNLFLFLPPPPLIPSFRLAKAYFIKQSVSTNENAYYTVIRQCGY
jgi:hypothetical protein